MQPRRNRGRRARDRNAADEQRRRVHPWTHCVHAGAHARAQTCAPLRARSERERTISGAIFRTICYVLRCTYRVLRRHRVRHACRPCVRASPRSVPTCDAAAMCVAWCMYILLGSRPRGYEGSFGRYGSVRRRRRGPSCRMRATTLNDRSNAKIRCRTLGCTQTFGRFVRKTNTRPGLHSRARVFLSVARNVRVLHQRSHILRRARHCELRRALCAQRLSSTRPASR